MGRSRGQIRRRGDKYLVRIYLGRINGKRKYKSKTVDGSKKDAERKLTEMLRKKDQGLIVEASQEKLDGFLDDWLRMKKTKVKAATYRNYEKAIRLYIKPALGYLRLDQLNTRLIQSFIDKLAQEEKLSTSYIRQIHVTLRAAIQRAVIWQMLPINPADGERLDFPKADEKDYRILSKQEAGKLLTVTQSERLHALWALLITTGLRPQEAFALKWKDLKDGWIYVRRVISVSHDAGKKYEVSNEMKTTQSKRRIKLPELTQQTLKAHRASQAEERLRAGSGYESRGFIFTRSPRSGEFIYHEIVRAAFNDALERAGLPADEIRPYDLRHTHISHLIMDGVGLKLASKRAGHSTIALTADTYAHLADESEEKMAEKVQAMYAKNGTNH